MTIIKSTPNLTRKEQYALCLSGNSIKMQDAAGQTLDLKAWALYQDVDKRSGELHEILSILTPENEVYATISRTFIEDFTRMVDFFGDSDPVTAITVNEGVSKNGRKFISCTIA